MLAESAAVLPASSRFRALVEAVADSSFPSEFVIRRLVTLRIMLSANMLPLPINSFLPIVMAASFPFTY
jgi:hypothetical protein